MVVLNFSAYRDELVEKYEKWRAKDDNSNRPIACLARDEMRKIRKVFERTFHANIDLYLH